MRLIVYPFRYIIYLGEPSGNIISNYHGTLYTYTCIDMIICLKYIYETVTFLGQCCRFFCPSLFSCQQYIKKSFIFLLVGFLFQLISVKFTPCRLPQANLLQHFILFSISKRQVQKPQPSLISFHLYGMIITFGG